MKDCKMISIVIPVFNESENIESITAKVIPTVEGYNYEVIFIDDGSKDNSIDIIMNINKRNIRIKGISFSRNFGKESAIMAGLAYSIGDAVITIDADLQHPPEKISEFLKKMGRWRQNC